MDMAKKSKQHERQRSVLMGLCDLYVKEGKPIGSNTLKENGFDSLSSATIRNYFAKLEAGGFLKQQHSSGGRVPTSLAYNQYAKSHYEASDLEKKDLKKLEEALIAEPREVASYLHKASELISEMTGCAVFLSSPRFDQDLITDVKLAAIDNERSLCILVTDFGLVHTEMLYSEKKLSSFSLKRIETYFRYRMTGFDRPELTKEEEVIATKFYNEVLLRHVVGYSNFSEEDIYRTGFSSLLKYFEFQDPNALASGLSLFEDKERMRLLLAECLETLDLKFWIGEELKNCSVIAVPYSIGTSVVGALATLGPNRLDYKRVFAILRAASHMISNALTQATYKHKITYREPKQNAPMISHMQVLTLEDKRRDNE
ncbi:MAG: Heat-inducible transcription repressor HrcA [Chlamydiia bacterium]|nr:Heat-inducible transcription repressor HrcA [Chlamydiia bacterium]MCH9616127.1 Heat-inducible transcription repressor HrcA [Chlamydiia bacterium]MCH9629450.1 Heat-inducible transcription repressor HrcA [Chlamydiia bacterium]